MNFIICIFIRRLLYDHVLIVMRKHFFFFFNKYRNDSIIKSGINTEVFLNNLLNVFKYF